MTRFFCHSALSGGAIQPKPARFTEYSQHQHRHPRENCNIATATVIKMEIEVFALTLCLIVSLLSFICSLTTLLIIRNISRYRYNGYIQLVASLTFCQLIYDLGFFLLPWYGTYYGRICYGVINMWGGIASSLWSNILIFVTCQIIFTSRSVDIHSNYKYYFCFVTIPATVISILEGIYVRHSGSTAIFYCYFILRSTSVVGNILLFLIIVTQLYHLHSFSTNDYSKLNSLNPIYVLSMRLIYYCLVQTITRVGASWYQLQYGYGHTYHHETASSFQTAAYLLEYILTPSAGIGYLIVFLVIQPDAQEVLWSLLQLPQWCCQRTERGGDQRGSSQLEELTVGLTDGEADEQVDDHRRSHRLFSDQSPLLPTASTASGAPYARGSRQSSSSLFPLLDMDEDDLAKEIDRLYYYTTDLIHNNTAPHMSRI
jgi:hypothetical protein